MSKNNKNNTQDNTKDFAAKVESLEKENAKLKKDIQEFETGWKRALADYQNLKKRVEKEKEEIILRANEILITKLVHILQHLNNMAKFLKDEGLMLTRNEFKTVLEQAGLTELNPEDETFDPNTMEAVEPAFGQKNKVVEVVQEGYMINGKLIIPTKVKVGNGEESPQQNNKTNKD
jgi:molecular chaperone GrpE